MTASTGLTCSYRCPACALISDMALTPLAPVSAVCAAVGTADKAFQLYTSMKAEGLKSDPQVLAAPLDIIWQIVQHIS